VTGRWVVEGLETELGRFHLGPIDLTVDPGHAVVVLGPSGAGKTTLLRALAGFVPLRAGRIRRDGVDLTDWPPEARALGYVPQGLGLLPHRTVAGNVRYPFEVRGRSGVDGRVRELLERFRLAELADRYPARLSGGEQQRVALARALAAEPSLIVWDEPWQGLDVLARHELGLVLHDLREVERIPVLVVTHDPTLAFSIADSFLVLRAGRVLGQGEPARLLDAPFDAFAARFVGFDNVYGLGELAGDPNDGLRGWLRDRAGPEGVAFPSPPALSAAGDGRTWTGRVRSVRPNPDGLAIEVACEGLVVLLRRDRSAGTAPTVGQEVGFALEPSMLRPLGARFGSAF
jgi:ABC-type Fe3+/spermidine/putrescine transport system ATPase subunit